MGGDMRIVHNAKKVKIRFRNYILWASDIEHRMEDDERGSLWRAQNRGR